MINLVLVTMIFFKKTGKIEIKAPTNINRNESISTKLNKTNSSISPIQIKIRFPRN